MNENLDNANEVTSVKKKCCGKVKNFFTKEAKEGQRVPNWKFAVAVVLVVAVVWVIL